MPVPFEGLASVAEYTTRFDADFAAAQLSGFGIEATVLGDPAAQVAPHHVTDRLFRVVVRPEIVDDARAVLGLDEADEEAAALDNQFYSRRFEDRPQWIQSMTWIVLIAFAGPILVAGLAILFFLLDGMFPG